MKGSDANDKHLEAILEAAKSIVEGDFSKEIQIDAEGIVANLASIINQIIRNFREVPPALSKADSEAPRLSSEIESLDQMMFDSTSKVLDRADKILNACQAIEELGGESPTASEIMASVKEIKGCAFDIISAQSFQDCARQQLMKMHERLHQIRDALIKVLIVMNLKKEQYTLKESTQKLIEEVKKPDEEGEGALKQDLVDELLAEFGL